jgi:hypothetical protein
MSATPPEANTEYSRGHGVFRHLQGDFSGSSRAGSPGATALVGATRAAFLIAGLLGAIVLVLAELTPLLHVSVSASSAPIKSVLTGAHHGYALLPIAALSVALTIGALRRVSRPALVALGILGLIALGIVLVGDLPDARASGLVGSSATRFIQARSSPAIGLYLETLGAVLLLLASGLGLLLLGGVETAGEDLCGLDPDIDCAVHRNTERSG